MNKYFRKAHILSEKYYQIFQENFPKKIEEYKCLGFRINLGVHSLRRSNRELKSSKKKADLASLTIKSNC